MTDSGANEYHSADPELYFIYEGGQMIMKNERNESTPDTRNKIFPVSIGLLMAISFGYSLNNWGLGVSLGLLWAVVFGLCDDEDHKEQDGDK